jgi:hypothetical protein
MFNVTHCVDKVKEKNDSNAYILKNIAQKRQIFYTFVAKCKYTG